MGAGLEEHHNPQPRLKCVDCGAELDPWGCCPGVSTELARVSSSLRSPLYCGKREPRRIGELIDLPGVGAVRANQPASDYTPGEVPSFLRRLVDADEAERVQLETARVRLLIEFLFSARNVANANVVRRIDSENTDSYSLCLECNAMARLRENVVHDAGCMTGIVLSKVNGLLEIPIKDYSSLIQIQKEEQAHDEEPRQAEAADGDRPRGTDYLHWPSAARPGARISAEPVRIEACLEFLGGIPLESISGRSLIGHKWGDISAAQLIEALKGGR
jgi:hypothetical protein